MDLSDTSRRRAGLARVGAAAFVVLLALLLLSPAFGRAEPVGSYRPPLPADALTNGCWPLPGDVRLDFGYQVRSDEVHPTTHGPRRQVVLHYDEVSGAEAMRLTQADFAAAGVDDVALVARDFVGVATDAVVRGQMLLDLPASKPEGRPACHQPFSTKRFAPPVDDRS